MSEAETRIKEAEESLIQGAKTLKKLRDDEH